MNENVKKVVARILKDIQVEMSDEFDKNFERQAFFSEKWQPTGKAPSGMKVEPY